MSKVKNPEHLTSVIQFENEIKYLKERLKFEGQTWGLVGKWADLAGCHRPQFSNILAEKASFTIEQAFQLAKGLGLSEIEREFFLLLVELRRSGLADYRNHIKQKIQKIRDEQERLELRLKRQESMPTSTPLSYYSAWFWSAIHIASSIPELQTPVVLAKALGLSKDFVLQILVQLESWGYVARSGPDHWVWVSGETHAPKSSPLSVLHQSNWRFKAIENAQMFRSHSVHFTGVYSMNQAAFDELKELLLRYIETYNQKASAAPAKISVCFNTDLFRILPLSD
jgi:plasmid maintenance system antidote protein VapI